MFSLQVAPGIELRQFDQADVGELFDAVERNRAYLRVWLPWVDQTLALADLRNFVHRAREQYEVNQSPQAAIRVEGRIAGAIGCHPIDWPNRHASIGYWLDGECQGRGLMTRCCAAMLDYLFDGLDIHRVTIRCGTGNARSCAIPERLGFEREGVMREAEWVNDRWVDLVTWAMLDRDWRTRRTAALSD